MTLPMPAVAAIYCRISNDADGRMLGVTRQERSCRRLAAQRSLAVAEVFVDNDVSAFSGARRPAYQRLLADLADGRFAAVLVWDGDRLHRSTRELEDFIDVIEATGTVVVTVTSGEIDFSSATGRMQVRIKGGISRYESEHKRERTTAAHAYLAETGRWKGGPRPYGYDVKRDNHGRSLRDGRLVVVPAEAAIVTEAAARVLAGESVYSICSDLNARKVPTAQGARWRTQTLRRVLTNPSSAAKREYHGEIVADALWPPILDEDTWHQLRSRLLPKGTADRDRPEPSQRGRRRALLSGGLAVCGICGTRLYSHIRQSGSGGYNCGSGPDKEGCGRVSVSARALERHVISVVLARYTHPDMAPEELLAEQPTPATPLEDGIQELSRLFADGRLSAQAWRIAAAGIAAIDAGVAALHPSSLQPHPALIDQWIALPLGRQRERIAEVLDHAIVSPTTQRGPTYDHSRVTFIWRTTGASTG